jgi:coenzyme PQQ precursor peptide PqqA
MLIFVCGFAPPTRTMLADSSDAGFCAALEARPVSGDSATSGRCPRNFNFNLEKTMWSKPEYTEMRFGFEVTMYIANR